MKVKEFPLKKIPISSIKFDKSNPNIVSDEQMEAYDHEDGYLLAEIDEMFKGIATNGFGIGIDFDEIRKAENMYDTENIDE